MVFLSTADVQTIFGSLPKRIDTSNYRLIFLGSFKKSRVTIDQKRYSVAIEQ